MHGSHGSLNRWNHVIYSAVIPAKAGIQPFQPLHCRASWIPAFAGYDAKFLLLQWLNIAPNYVHLVVVGRGRSQRARPRHALLPAPSRFIQSLAAFPPCARIICLQRWKGHGMSPMRRAIAANRPAPVRRGERWNIAGNLFHGVSSVPSTPAETAGRADHGGQMEQWNMAGKPFHPVPSADFHSPPMPRPCLPGASRPFPAGHRRAILGGWASVSDA